MLRGANRVPCLDLMLKVPGIYLIMSGQLGFYAEVDASGQCYQLNPKTFARDGDPLPRDKWYEDMITSIEGPLKVKP